MNIWITHPTICLFFSQETLGFPYLYPQGIKMWFWTRCHWVSLMAKRGTKDYIDYSGCTAFDYHLLLLPTFCELSSLCMMIPVHITLIPIALKLQFLMFPLGVFLLNPRCIVGKKKTTDGDFTRFFFFLRWSMFSVGYPAWSTLTKKLMGKIHHAINGKIHELSIYFYGHGFNSTL